MQRQGNIWTGTLPFILGLALLLGCFVCSGQVRAEGTETDVLQGADIQSGGLSRGTDADGAGTVLEQKKPAKAARSKVKATPAKPAGAKTGELGQPSEETAAQVPTKKQYTGKAISLDLMDADLRNVLRLLSDLAGINIAIEPNVSGKVTLKVEQVPWDQVLDMVLSMNDLGKEQVGNVIRVATQAKLQMESVQQTQVIQAKQALVDANRNVGTLATKYFSVNYSKPSDIAEKINAGKTEKGKVSIDERTNTIIYTDFPARLEDARQLIVRLDRPTPQVLIEARIITLNSDTKRQLGVQLSFSSQQNVTSVPNSQDFFLNPPIPGTPQFVYSMFQLVGKSLLHVDLEIQALESVALARIVAAPRVLTLDNVKAVVTQGKQVPYVTVGTTPTTGSIAANTTEFKDATLELQVTPHITPDRKVRMLVVAKQDTVDSTVLYNGEPAIDTRKIQSELLVDDGNVIVIGGVIDNESSASKTATPGLADIPILGRLFKSEQSEDIRNELLIFISPKIVEVPKPFDKT